MNKLKAIAPAMKNKRIKTLKLENMKKYKVTITIEAPSTEAVKQVGSLLQGAVNKVEQQDMIRLLDKVVRNPGIVKTALKFI